MTAFKDLTIGTIFTHKGIRYYKDSERSARDLHSPTDAIQIFGQHTQCVTEKQESINSMNEAFQRLDDFNHDR